MRSIKTLIFKNVFNKFLTDLFDFLDRLITQTQRDTRSNFLSIDFNQETDNNTGFRQLKSMT